MSRRYVPSCMGSYSASEVSCRLTSCSRPQLEDLRKNEDPRLSFATPEFKEAQRAFTERFKVSQKTMSVVPSPGSCSVLQSADYIVDL